MRGALLALVLGAGSRAIAQDAPLVVQAPGGQASFFPADVAQVGVTQDAELGPSVEIELTGWAAQDLAELTRDRVGEMVAVRFCGALLLEATLRDEILDGRILIWGQGLIARALLVAVLRGQVPCPAPVAS